MTTNTQMQPAWQGHKYTESTDSEISFFDPSTSSTEDSWSGYFEGWDAGSRDSYCPQIASASNSPTRSLDSDKTPVMEIEQLLPSACPRRSRAASMRRDGQVVKSPIPPKRTKRSGIVPHPDSRTGEQAIARLDTLLDNPLSNTEDILSAMYSSDWDVASLQRWYDQSSKTPADLALFKIMFSLRYTIDNPSPLS